MGTGQMLLSICAVVLLGATILSVNSSTLNQGTILRQSQSGIYAVSLANSYIQKALSLDFDEKTVTRPSALATNTPPSMYCTRYDSLGPETPATHQNKWGGATEYANQDSSFDDIDDYNNFSIDTAITNVDKFHVSAKVYYVTQPTGAQPTPTYTTTQTWLKRIDLCVNSSINRTVATGLVAGKDIGTDTIKISYIKSFY
jgi:hypothetical protein